VYAECRQGRQLIELKDASRSDSSQAGVGNVLNGIGNGRDNLLKDAGNGVGSPVDSAGGSKEKRSD